MQHRTEVLLCGFLPSEAPWLHVSPNPNVVCCCFFFFFPVGSKMKFLQKKWMCAAVERQRAARSRVDNQPLPGAGLKASNTPEAAPPRRHNKQQCPNQPSVSFPLCAGRGESGFGPCAQAQCEAPLSRGLGVGACAVVVRIMAGPGLVAGDVVVDALPYFDQGYEAPGVREAVSAGRAGPGWGGAPRSRLTPPCARLRLWWRRRRGATGPRRTTSATCRHTTAAPSRWAAPPRPVLPRRVAPAPHRPLPADRDHAERVRAPGGPAAPGAAQHEEVRGGGAGLRARLRAGSERRCVPGTNCRLHPPGRRTTSRRGRSASTTPWRSWSTRLCASRTWSWCPSTAATPGRCTMSKAGAGMTACEMVMRWLKVQTLSCWSSSPEATVEMAEKCMKVWLQEALGLFQTGSIDDLFREAWA